MAAKKSVLGQPELGSKKKRNPLQDGTLPGGDRSSELCWGKNSWVDLRFGLGISEEMDVLDVFPVSDLRLKMFFLRKRLNGLAGENTVNQMWFQQTNRGDSLPPQRPTFLRSRDEFHANRCMRPKCWTSKNHRGCFRSKLNRQKSETILVCAKAMGHCVIWTCHGCELDWVIWFQQSYNTQWIWKQDCRNVKCGSSTVRVNRSLGLAFSKHFHQRIAVSPSAALTLFSTPKYFLRQWWFALMLGRGANTFELCPSERMAVDFFVMQDVLYGKGCHWMSVTTVIMLMTLICFWLLTDLQPCITKNVVHVQDLEAKAMGNGQSRLRLCLDAPWQGQAKRSVWLSASIT